MYIRKNRGDRHSLELVKKFASVIWTYYIFIHFCQASNFLLDVDIIDNGSGSDGYTEKTFSLDLNNCYTFKLYDSYGNGFRPGGYCKLKNSDNIEIINVEGDFGSLELIPFKISTVSSVEDNIQPEIDIYPSPVTSSLFIRNKANVTLEKVEIVNLTGKVIYSKGNNFSTLMDINTKNIKSGTYFVNIYTDKNVITKKVLVIK